MVQPQTMSGTRPDESNTASEPAVDQLKGSDVSGVWRQPDGGTLPYGCRAQWTVLRDGEKPVAEIFFTSYMQENVSDRPITFVFNGGPGAASAYLHVGALGTRRVAFSEDGTLLPPPTRLVDNAESWLDFTDLVFVDPVGTGFSRVIEKSDPENKAKEEAGSTPKKPRSFFGLTRDLESLGEFMSRYLSENDRWESPVYIAGESYGGFRVAKLARLLTEKYGVGLNGAILISPALEFALLDTSDYDLLHWLDGFPSMAAAAAFHGKSGMFSPDTPLEKILAEAESFATTDYATFLAQGASMPSVRRNRIMGRASRMLGLSKEMMVRSEGRIRQHRFVRELLRDQGKVLGLYDATITTRDPFPDREGFEWPDPTLAGIERVFTAGINKRLRSEIGVDTEREYHLLSHEVNKAWKIDVERHALMSQIGATDDLRYGMSLNPFMKVFITHGVYDLVTPYFSTNRIRNLMRLDPGAADKLTVRHFGGGHMFYAWEKSRIAFRDEMKAFYLEATD
jgi:carboxypeptidase C (cathepsin A)